ncbi:thiosulfohydrolase SoxB [Paracoccus saliphilus]|uniref:Sulfate thiol esterase SoxB n=1 Tax=Paracoccus saliphilus TaxID=405559 RepID=A0AA46A6T3_9RHOB|nr:thiosulfohydrolase SoxB [Paracoccus saliphilus]WCR02888.1 thiosulfohydrolase SoxB [Paracoccus saliphilus]SIT03338.1 sulfate thiol esterase SoxB [Paracoccus saliphilus]
MFSRREMLQLGLAGSAAMTGLGFSNLPRAFAQQALTQDQLLQFEDFGNLTLIHLTDCHAHLRPIYFREPDTNIGVGDAKGRVPHVVGEAFQKMFGIEPGSPGAYALTWPDFTDLARSYGRMGGFDRIATVVKAIRAARPDSILLDGGDTWQGSYTSLQTRGEDMVRAMNLLGSEAMTAHWEFTFGTERVQELMEMMDQPLLGANIFDAEWDEPAFEPSKIFEKGGLRVGVVGQAFPYTPIANPNWMFPEYSFGIREERMQQVVDDLRAEGVDLVVCLSHNGFDVDHQMASRVKGIDVILSGHTHDAIPEPVVVGDTIIIASGSHGKFVSRVDLDVRDGKMMGFRHKLIPIFSDVIQPDPDMASLVEEIRAPYKADLEEVIGKTEGLLYRRGNFNGSWDDLICDAMLSERDAEIALSPGVRWGASVLPGDITREDIHSVTSMTYGQVYRTEMSGEMLKTVMEDVADNIFNTDPYYQQGGDMVRVGGLGYSIEPYADMGSRITGMKLLKDDSPIDPARNYVVAGWASVNEGTEGPQIWDLVEDYIRTQGTISPAPNNSITVKED